MANGNTVVLSDHWALVQRQMAAALEASRHQPHCGSGGDASELDWASWLENYLPGRYAVIHDAFVVDCLGKVSDQLDVVIYDRHFTPRVFVNGVKTWVPAEAVYAVVECKARLDAEKVKAAGDKVASVRGMERRSKLHVDNSKKVEKKAEPKPILGVLVADRSEWVKPLGTALRKALVGLSALERLDLVCAVGDCGVSVAWETDAEEPASVKQVADEFALVGFFAELVSKLQALGSVAPIDFDAYTEMLTWSELPRV